MRVSSNQRAQARSIVLDVGETLVDETRMWHLWADWLGVARAELLACLDDMIGKRHHHRRVFEHFKPGFDLVSEIRRREASSCGYRLSHEDFYPDALPFLSEATRRGYLIGIAGNQPQEAELLLTAMALPVAFVAGSSAWGVEKPSAAFFTRVAAAAGCKCEEIVYVGDRLDNDVLPAKAAGMQGAYLRRGPWARVQASWPEAASADFVVDGLAQLLESLTVAPCGASTHGQA